MHARQYLRRAYGVPHRSVEESSLTVHQLDESLYKPCNASSIFHNILWNNFIYDQGFMFRIFRLDYALSSISLQVIRTTLSSCIFFPKQGVQKDATCGSGRQVTLP